MKYNHLTIDASGCINTDSHEAVYRFLLGSVKVAKMKILKRGGVVNPQLFFGSKKLPGYSGTAIIETSHISVHTFSDTKKINFDIYSCKPFDNYLITNYFRKIFQPKKMDIQGLRRK